MTRFLIIIFSLTIYVMSVKATGIEHEEISCCISDDLDRAKKWCDDNMLMNVEGIWEFPEDMTRVLIKKDSVRPNRFDIIVLESPDTRIRPGESMGYLQCSAASDKFEMGIYRTRMKQTLSQLGTCLAELKDKDGAIYVSGKKAKFSIGSRWILPSFWKIVRISVKNPLESLPKGLVRLYPNPVKEKPYYL